LDSFEEIVQMAKKKEIALFLDYDGTLAPIVRDPERAYMSNEVNELVFLFGSPKNCGNLYLYYKYCLDLLRLIAASVINRDNSVWILNNKKNQRIYLLGPLLLF
jgi:hypothetical protein